MTTTTVKPPSKTKFCIDVKRLKSLLSPVFKTINGSIALDILEDVLVVGDGKNISFSSTDLENITTVSVPYTGDKFSFVFPGTEFRYLTKNSIANELSILLSGSKENQELIITNGGFAVRLFCQNVDNFPKLVKIKNEKSFTIDVKEFIPILGKALMFVSDDNLRPSLTSVCLNDWNGKLYMVATDAHRMIWHHICKTPEEYKDCSLLISKKAATLAIDAFKTEKEITLSLAERYFQFECDNKKLTTRLIDYKFVLYKQVIPEKLPLTFYLDRKELAAFLLLCQPFTNKSTRQLNVKVSPDKIELYGGDADFSIDFNYAMPVLNPTIDTFDPFIFGVDAKFFREALICSGEDLVKIDHSMSPLKAIIIDDHVLIMPLMLNS